MTTSAFPQLGRMVHARRAALGISQAEVARRIGLAPSVVSRIERGQRELDTGTFHRLAVALECRVVLGFDFGSAEQPDFELSVV